MLKSTALGRGIASNKRAVGAGSIRSPLMGERQSGGARPVAKLFEAQKARRHTTWMWRMHTRDMVPATWFPPLHAGSVGGACAVCHKT